MVFKLLFAIFVFIFGSASSTVAGESQWLLNAGLGIEFGARSSDIIVEGDEEKDQVGGYYEGVSQNEVAAATHIGVQWELLQNLILGLENTLIFLEYQYD